MSEQIREQVSAFLDGELPGSETELLLKRLMRDADLRESFGRYALVGECLRGAAPTHLSQGFAVRINRAIDGEPPAASPQPARARSARWWRPFASVAVAAGVAAVAVVALQQRAVAPTLHAAQPMLGQNAVVASAKPKEALSYTVPDASGAGPTVLPAARLTNYVFAHSRYSSVMGQNDVLNDLLSAADAEDTGATEVSRDARVAP
ncbi:MAG: sigma-E factor negative regulatory protein [Pseudomonadota bacterium]|nr:sigma-E factor negative regulatory protein [Pseudomonadota bacterium]